MSESKILYIAIAESSTIIRKGVIATLKQLLDGSKQFIEITSTEQLTESFRHKQIDVLIINPLLYNTIEHSKLKANSSFKCIALQTSIADKNLFNSYDGVISLYENDQEIVRLFNSFIEHKNEEEDSEEVLSQREKEIIVCIVKGMTNKEIADKLFISVHTVITHRRNITRKLEIHSTAGLTIYAIINKLIDINDAN